MALLGGYGGYDGFLAQYTSPPEVLPVAMNPAALGRWNGNDSTNTEATAVDAIFNPANPAFNPNGWYNVMTGQPVGAGSVEAILGNPNFSFPSASIDPYRSPVDSPPTPGTTDYGVLAGAAAAVPSPAQAARTTAEAISGGAGQALNSTLTGFQQGWQATQPVSGSPLASVGSTLGAAAQQFSSSGVGSEILILGGILILVLLVARK